eukprot:304072-Chlamydomonas_euryale.AAC.5
MLAAHKPHSGKAWAMDAHVFASAGWTSTRMRRSVRGFVQLACCLVPTRTQGVNSGGWHPSCAATSPPAGVDHLEFGSAEELLHTLRRAASRDSERAMRRVAAAGQRFAYRYLHT